ncbi:MAG: hypothetical protein ACFFDI_19810 [Promethearchaeota archaeon]
MLGVCRTTIKRWDAAGHMQCYRTPGVHRRISLVKTERILAEDLKEDLEGTDGSQVLADRQD